jgi:hypothetical protein
MKLCWDNLNNISFSKNGNFKLNHNTYYIRMCCECNQEYLGTKQSIYCTNDCKLKSPIRTNKLSLTITGKGKEGRKLSDIHKKKIGDGNRGKSRTEKTKILISNIKKSLFENACNHPAWKGGYRTNNIPLYDTYAHQLDPYEQCQRNLDDPNILEVKCTYCGKWHVPTRTSVCNRIKSMDQGKGGFYCSNACKTMCPIYKQVKYTKNNRPQKYRPHQIEWAKMIITLDDNICQLCGSSNDLTAHHIKPVSSHPHLSLDKDNGIALCKKCANWVHNNDEKCKYNKIKRC